MTRFVDLFSGVQTLEAEKARLEAFLAAVPGDYCGWSVDGSAAYSAGFCKLLGLETVERIEDVQNCLNPSDAAALEGVYNRLKQENIPFSLSVKSLNGQKAYKLSGSKGKNLSQDDSFIVLWIEDVTRDLLTQEKFQKELEDQELRLKTLNKSLDSFPKPLWRRDDTLDIIWCNKAYAELVNADCNTVHAEQIEVSPASKKKKKKQDGEILLGRDLAQKALEDRSSQESALHVISAGKRLLMRISENPVDGDSYTLGFAEDITRQEELENSLKRYQATNQELLEQLRTAIAIYNDAESLEFYNSAFSQLWGLEEGWLNTKPKLGDVMEKLRDHRKLPEQADFRRFKQSWLDMFTSLIDPFDDMLYLPDGAALRMLVVPQSAGGLMMTFEDVTSNLELESSINTLIAVQKETLDNLAEGVAVYGGDGRLKLCNPSYNRLWGFNPEDLEGEPHINQLVEKKKAYFEEKEWLVKKEELRAASLDRVLHEGRLLRSDDTLVDYSTVPLPDGGVLVTYTDVTDTVRVENALREKNAALEAAEKLKIDFLANVSYQLRTPLNAIMGFNEILDQEYFGELNTRQKEYTNDIRSAGDRLVNLINDILDLSTIEAGYLTLEKEEVKIKEMLEKLTDLMQEWTRKEKIEVSLKCPSNIGKIEIDERRMKQALVNLVRNSIAFTPSGGKITLHAKRKKKGIEIAVSDTGIGISRENQLRVFEPFEKANRGNSDEISDEQGSLKMRSGAGLGLSLVKNIVALHDGSVELQSEPGEGTTVTLYIPFETSLGTQAIKMKKSLSLY